MPSTASSSALSPADLSLASRVGQVNQRLKGWEAVRWVDGSPQVTDVLREEIDRYGSIGALYGVLRADPWSAVRWGSGIPPERSAEAYAAVQDEVLSRGDGVPVLFVEEAPHGLMALGGTTIPVNLAIGAGMDARLAQELGEAVAAESRARGTHLLLISGLDVLRDARWGRSEECYSEDPAISAMLVEATIRGMQGDPEAPFTPSPIDGDHVAVVAKHLAGQGAGIGGRNGSGAPIGPRELGEIHLRPAHVAARAGVAGFMSAYNDVDGVPCTGSRELLTGTLRKDWGWGGIVMSDGGAIDRLALVTGDLEGAAALALHAGVDLSLWDQSFMHIEAAIDRGLVEESALDLAVSRVLALKERLGLIDASPAPTTPRRDPARTSIGLSERAARQAVVVLEDGGLLPLRASTLAVVGPNADDLDALLGDYSPPRPPQDPEGSTVRAALVDHLGAGAVRHARGSNLRTPLPADSRDAAGLAPLEQVTAAAAASEVTVVVLGGTSRRSYEDEFADNGAIDGPAGDTTNGEGVDLAEVSVPAAQLDVARAARAAGTPVIGVVIDGRPRALAELAEIVDALVMVPFPGPSGGRAVAQALLGGTDRGLLPATLPARDGVTPISHDQRIETARGYLDEPHPRGALLGAGLPAGVTAHVTSADPREITADDLRRGGSVPLTVRIQSTVERPMSLPVILYGRRHEAGILPRTRTVLAARRAEIGPGTTEVALELGLDELGSWAGGSPVAVPVEVSVWAEAVLSPPEGAARIRVIG